MNTHLISELGLKQFCNKDEKYSFKKAGVQHRSVAEYWTVCPVAKKQKS